MKQLREFFTLALAPIMKFILFTAMLLFFSEAKADKFDDAKNAYQKFVDGYENIRTLTKDEEAALISAVCEAEEDDIVDIAKSKASEIETKVNDKNSTLKGDMETALKLIDAALNDETLKDKGDELKKYRDRIDELWKRVLRMQDKVRASSNPIFAFLTKIGNLAHKDYQEIHSSEGIAEFKVPSGKIDLVTYSCDCIEVKANNSKSISKGKSEVQQYADDLNKNNDVFESLVKENTKFAECKGSFKPVVVAYYYCPGGIDDEGDLKPGPIGYTEAWRK